MSAPTSAANVKRTQDAANVAIGMISRTQSIIVLKKVNRRMIRTEKIR